MQILSNTGAYLLLVLFALAMILLTHLASRSSRWHTAEGFMAAGRQVPWWLGAVSIAVSWIWAPALFVSVQQAYQQGIPGLFWFTFPNILCLFIMAPLAIRIREYFPAGYSQPEWIRHRFDSKTHKLYLIPFFWYQLMAVTVQLYAGGSIFSFLTGTSIEVVMLVLAVTTLTYGIISGMRASIVTDFLQYSMIILGGLIIVPWTLSAAGGWSAIGPGFAGNTGQHGSIFDAEVAYNFGIITTIGLISGVLSDQQHWQRAFTIKKEQLKTAYIIAGLLFAVVPLSLSLLGFIAANPANGIQLPVGTDPSLIGVVTVAHYLPAWAVVLFLIMLLCGLCSTLDSGLCAASSLYALNCFKWSEPETRLHEKLAAGKELSADEKTFQHEFDRKIVRRGRNAMIGITIAGLLVAFAVLRIPGFGLKYLWWVFNTVAACVAVPTVLSLYSARVDAKGVYWGIIVALIVGLPTFIYASANELTGLMVASSLGIVFVTTFSALLVKRTQAFPFKGKH